MQLVQAFFRDIPNRTQLFDYGSREDGQPDYMGYAPKDTAEGSAKWVIFKFTYDVNSNTTRIDSVGDASWTLRTSYF